MSRVGMDNHHILHDRQEWELRPEARRLRQSKPLVPYIGRVIHDHLHVEVPPVPLLGYNTLVHVERLYRPAFGDTLKSMDNLLFAINEASRHHRAHPIDRDLAQLAMQAIELQKPYIREGLPSGSFSMEIAA